MDRRVISVNKRLLLVLLFLFGIAIWIFSRGSSETKRSSVIVGTFDPTFSVVQEDEAIVCKEYFYDKHEPRSSRHKR